MLKMRGVVGVAEKSSPSQSEGDAKERSEFRRGCTRRGWACDRQCPTVETAMTARDNDVIPADAGTQSKAKHAAPAKADRGGRRARGKRLFLCPWIPASAGMTGGGPRFPHTSRHSRDSHVIPADAGTQSKAKHAAPAQADRGGRRARGKRLFLCPWIPASAGMTGAALDSRVRGNDGGRP